MVLTISRSESVGLSNTQSSFFLFFFIVEQQKKGEQDIDLFETSPET